MELDGPVAKRKNWDRIHKSRERKLYETLHNYKQVSQFSVETVRTAVVLKLQLIKYHADGKELIREEILDINTTVTEAAGLKNNLENEAERLQYEARLSYLKSNWKNWEELLLPYDPTAQHLKALEEAIAWTSTA